MEDAVERLLNIDEVAERLKVPVLTIRWLRQEARFAPAIRVGRRLVWSESDIEAWVAAHKEAPAA